MSAIDDNEQITNLVLDYLELSEDNQGASEHKQKMKQNILQVMKSVGSKQIATRLHFAITNEKSSRSEFSGQHLLNFMDLIYDEVKGEESGGSISQENASIDELQYYIKDHLSHIMDSCLILLHLMIASTAFQTDTIALDLIVKKVRNLLM
jgi:hypothetical protein